MHVLQWPRISLAVHKVSNLFVARCLTLICVWVSGSEGKREWDGNGKREQQKMPDESYHVNIQVTFYSMMALYKSFGPFYTVRLK